MNVTINDTQKWDQSKIIVYGIIPSTGKETKRPIAVWELNVRSRSLHVLLKEIFTNDIINLSFV